MRRHENVQLVVLVAALLIAIVGAGHCDDRYGYPEPQPWIRHPRPNFALAMLGDGRVLWFGPQSYDYYDPRFTAEPHPYYAPRPYVVPRAYANPCRTQGSFVVDWRKTCNPMK